MCGIAGFCNFQKNFLYEQDKWQRVLVEMREAIAHRGPDQTGEYLRRTVGLAHTRLSIRDLSGGAQPLVRRAHGEEYGIVYNGTAAQNTQLLNLMRGGSAPAASSYYPVFSSSSIVDGLKSIGVDSSYSNRARIAAANGIANYSGTAAQNNTLCSLAKQGRLKKA